MDRSTQVLLRVGEGIFGIILSTASVIAFDELPHKKDKIDIILIVPFVFGIFLVYNAHANFPKIEPKF